MKNHKFWLRCCIVPILLLAGFTRLVTAQPKASQTTQAENKASAKITQAELLALIERAQTVATQAQTEAQTIRTQNEILQRQLSQTAEEMAALRQQMASVTAQLSQLQNETAKIDNAANTKIATLTQTQSAVTTRLETVDNEIASSRELADVHTAQLNEHAQTKVESESKTRLKIFGTILANTYFNTRDSSLTDVPLFAPAPTSTVRKNNFGSTLRQTKFGFLFNGPTLGDSLGGARASAEAEFDFWGGVNEEVAGVLRLETASVRLDWDKTSFVVGQRPPLISPRNPSSIATVWFPAFTSSGNLWQWRPQIMVEHRIKAGDNNEWQWQGGLLTSFGESLQGSVIEGGPGYETRLGFTRALASDHQLELGVGGYVHRRGLALNRNVTAFAITSDWALPLGEKIEISGETFFGRANNLGDGAGFRADRHIATTGVLTSANSLVRGVFSVGGWTQFKFRARSDLDFNLAYGQEDPRNRDLRFGQPTANTRYKNQSASANFIWNWRQNFLLSLEYRRFWTNYATSQQKSGHVNLAIGYTF